MILSKLVYDVREGIRKHSDDNDISDEYIIHLINTHRSYIIRNELNNFQRVSPQSVAQKLCIGLEEIPASECGVDTCETMLRSTTKIPTVLDLHTGVSIIDVRSVLKNVKPFKLTTKQRATFRSGNFNKITAYVDTDDYLYLTGGDSVLSKMLQCVVITGVFEDPTEVVDIENRCESCKEHSDNTCDDILDMDYPIPSNLIKFVRDEIVNKLAPIINIPNDKVNDANEQH